MRIPALASTAAFLVFGLAGCGGTSPTTQEPTPAATSATTEATTTEAPTTDAPTYEAGGQATPDAAAQVFLRAFGNVDAKGACAVMASGQTTLEGKPQAIDACAKILQGTMDSMRDSLADLKEATVSGATVSGNSATFENATVDPQLAKDVIDGFKAVQIGGKWYITN